MPRAVVGAGPYKGVWYLPDKLQFEALSLDICEKCSSPVDFVYKIVFHSHSRCAIIG